MSALYSLALEKLGSQRGYVAAGLLFVDDKRVFGEEKEFDGKELLSESNLDWNGHAWVDYGDWLADGLPVEQDRARDGLQMLEGAQKSWRRLDGHNQS
jgi:hypothetical protein